MKTNPESTINKPNPRTEAGSTIMLATLMLAILIFVGANVLQNVSRRYNGNQQSQGWQEALSAAETGVDTALINCRWTKVKGSPAAFSSANGWTTTKTSNNTTYTCTTPIVTQSGQGTVQTWAVVTVDSPVGDNTATPPAGLTDKWGNQWYRVRSTGHARIPGLARASLDVLSGSGENHTSVLRKLNLRRDRDSGAALTAPEAVRTVEVLIQPKTTFRPALLTDTSMKIKGDKTPVIDSFDSSDPTKSGANGQYDATKHQANASVMSNGSDNKALTIDKLVKVYGDAGTNGANFTDPNNTIQTPGVINNSIYTKIDPVPLPNWGTPGAPAINNSVTSGKNDVTITVDSDPSKNYYKLDTIEKTTTLKLPGGMSSGTIYIWLTDKMKGTLTIPKGVTAVMYFSGKTFHPKDDDKKNGIDNQNQNAANFQLFGVDPVKGNQKYDFKLTDTSFYGSIYAPSGDIKLKADSSSKSGTAFIGSIVADTLEVQGDVHYDEGLSGAGEVLNYARCSYAEDPR